MSIAYYYAFFMSLLVSTAFIVVGAFTRFALIHANRHEKKPELNLFESRVSLWQLAPAMLVAFSLTLIICNNRSLPDSFIQFKNQSAQLQFFVIMTLLGPLIEVVWTVMYGIFSDIFNKRRINYILIGQTYLWMFLIYGAGAYLFSAIYPFISSEHWLIRGVVYLGGIYCVEYISAKLLEKGVGKIPWDYSKHTKYHFQGAIRWDYAPAWFFFGLAMEQILIKLIH